MCVNELVAKGCKDVSSSDVYNSGHHYHVIVVSFRFEPLLSYLISRIDASGSDSKCWSLTSNGMPLVKSFYDLLIDGRKCCSMTPIIWRDMCPLKVKKSLIGWLRKPNSHSPKYDTSIYKKLAVVPCVLCYADMEIVDHLILLYPFSKKVWDCFVYTLRFARCPNSMGDLLDSWRAHIQPQFRET